MEPLPSIARALREDKRAVIVTVVAVGTGAPSRKGLKLMVLENGPTFGTLGCDGFDRRGEADAVRALAEGPAEASYPWKGGEGIEVEVRPYSPGDALPATEVEIPELLVVGRGPVARALVALGAAMGYHVRVAAGPEPPSVGEFDGADEVIIAPDARAVEALRPGPNTHVVICGHDPDFSQPALLALAGSEAPYIGMMGSRRHTGHVYDRLASMGSSDEQIARVHTPVGLDLGAETPEEIALSVLSQIVAVRRGGSARPLRHTT
jgi:xanthine dehydrogenase accessory factor